MIKIGAIHDYNQGFTSALANAGSWISPSEVIFLDVELGASMNDQFFKCGGYKRGQVPPWTEDQILVDYWISVLNSCSVAHEDMAVMIVKDAFLLTKMFRSPYAISNLDRHLENIIMSHPKAKKYAYFLASDIRPLTQHLRDGWLALLERAR